MYWELGSCLWLCVIASIDFDFDIYFDLILNFVCLIFDLSVFFLSLRACICSIFLSRKLWRPILGRCGHHWRLRCAWKTSLHSSSSDTTNRKLKLGMVKSISFLNSSAAARSWFFSHWWSAAMQTSVFWSNPPSTQFALAFASSRCEDDASSRFLTESGRWNREDPCQEIHAVLDDASRELLRSSTKAC